MTSATRTVSAPDPLVSPVSSSKRYLAVDLLRGLTIAFMILVNDNGSERAFWALKHAEWNGFTPTDLVFPTFLFLVGASIVFSTESRLARGVTRASLFAHTVRRAVIIFLLGFVVNSAPVLPPLIPALLRSAAAYRSSVISLLPRSISGFAVRQAPPPASPP